MDTPQLATSSPLPPFTLPRPPSSIPLPEGGREGSGRKEGGEKALGKGGEERRRVGGRREGEGGREGGEKEEEEEGGGEGGREIRKTTFPQSSFF